MIKSIEDAETAVRNIFIDEFPGKIFNEWNTDIFDKIAQDIIKNVGRASRINVKKFIEDLW